MDTTALMRDLYDYHRWANRTLFEEALARGEDAVERDLGTHWSFPSIRRMFAHIYAADAIWLARWKGSSPTAMPGADIGSLKVLRERWDALEAEQRAFVDALGEADVVREIHFTNTQGKAYHAPLAGLLQHVVNHATHHRSEIATMMTIVSGSPSDTGMNGWIMARTGQA
jgi:uncharacterized damage-inducible protein DinB